VSALGELRNVSLSFGGVSALDDVSFDIIAGELTAVIGPNGAGKTSLFNCMSGIYRATSGHVAIAGHDVTRLSQHRIARLGVARTFQSPALFAGLSVLDNLMTGRYLHGRTGVISGLLRLPRGLREEVEQRRRVEEILDLLEISHLRDENVADLPYGLQKRVEFGRALAQEPQLLLLDEPMAGMTIDEKQDMSAFVVAARRAMGTTFVLVEHDMAVVMSLADRVVVLDFGRRSAIGTPDEVQRDPAVIGAYLGTTKNEPVAEAASTP
jgi:branched-chain amino acid transport system ATP-binding protein